MDFQEVYQPQFWTDGIYAWSANGVMSLMIDDGICKDTETLMEKTCSMLNGSLVPTKKLNLVYSPPTIYLNEKPFLIIRGWGHLKAEGFSENDAIKIQDDFAKWVMEKISLK